MKPEILDLSSGTSPLVGANLKPATVISVRRQDREALMADPSFVYCGRSMPRIGWVDQGFGNPYPVNRNGNGFNFFYESLYDAISDARSSHPKIDAMIPRLSELHGKRLGCWCGSWEPGQPPIGCHAVVLADLANRIEGREVVRRPVRRGHITRFSKEREWLQWLVRMRPGEECVDGDAVPYYSEPNDGGPLVEFYGYEVDPTIPVYRRLSDL